MSRDIRRSVYFVKARGRWRAEYWPPDSSKPVTKTTFLKEKDGWAWLDEQIAEIKLGPAVVNPMTAKSRMTVKQFAEERFWPTVTVRRTTYRDQMNMYENHVLPKWGEVALGDVEIEDVEFWRKSLASRPKRTGTGTLGVSMQRQVYFLFHKIMGIALERGYIDHYPFPRVSGIPKPRKRKVEGHLTHPEVDRLAAECHGYEVFIYALAYGGFRIGEGVALRINDLDFEHNEIAVDEGRTNVGGVTEYGEPKRERSHRSVPMPQRVMDMIRALVRDRRQDSDGFVFLTPTGRPIHQDTFRNRSWHPAVRVAGLVPLRPHDLRHTAASTWFDAGFDLVDVARFLGDTLAQTEGTYIHLYRKRREDLMGKLNARLDESFEARSRPVEGPNIIDLSRRRPEAG